MEVDHLETVVLEFPRLLESKPNGAAELKAVEASRPTVHENAQCHGVWEDLGGQDKFADK